MGPLPRPLPFILQPKLPTLQAAGFGVMADRYGVNRFNDTAIVIVMMMMVIAHTPAGDSTRRIAGRPVAANKGGLA